MSFRTGIVKFLPVNVHDSLSVSARMPPYFWRIRVDKQTQTELEAAAFRRLTSHLQQHTDVQNIELMVLADFCRNCLAKWLVAAAQERDVALDYEQAREQVYGMPYREWKDKFQTEATQEQLAAYQRKQPSKS
jgi:hypothetical protein